MEGRVAVGTGKGRLVSELSCPERRPSRRKDVPSWERPSHTPRGEMTEVEVDAALPILKDVFLDLDFALYCHP